MLACRRIEGHRNMRIAASMLRQQRALAGQRFGGAVKREVDDMLDADGCQPRKVLRLEPARCRNAIGAPLPVADIRRIGCSQGHDRHVWRTGWRLSIAALCGMPGTKGMG